jgi:flavin-dependent dehydrogenase
LYDVAVLGGGPAGAATALQLARRGRNTVVIEKTRFDSPRFGETLPPEINPLLRRLGIWNRFLATSPVESPGTIAVWGSSRLHETDFVENRYGCGWHIDRNAFDSMVCIAATDAGALILADTRALRCIQGVEGTWTIRTTNCSSREIHARFLVDATGRNGFRRGAGDGRRVDDRLVAVFLRFVQDNVTQDLRTLVESSVDGWWYSAPLPSSEIVAAFFVDPHLYVEEGIDLREQLGRAPLTSRRVRHARLISSHVVHVSSSVRRRAAALGWAAVGDAAVSYDPLSGYGITGAFDTAVELVNAIEANDLDAYATGVSRRFDAYVAQRRAYYALEHRWPHSIFWRNRRRRGDAPNAGIETGPTDFQSESGARFGGAPRR